MSRHSRRCFIRLGASLALAGTLARRVPRVRAQEPAPPPAALLDGMLLSAEEAADANGRLPVAVMVDNLPGAGGARPQYGLDRADIVYELLVEGGITRFLAVYLRREAARIEPVRSVRTPYLYLVAELDAVLAHVGAAETEGDTDSRSQMEAWGIRHVEETVNPAAFRRDRARLAPHNAVTGTAEVRAEAEALGWSGPPSLEPWLFKDDLAPVNVVGGLAGRVSYAFAIDGLPPQDAFAIDWYFDPAINGYRRWMGGLPHADAITGETLSARNVIIQMDHAAIVNHEGHVLYGSTGEGPAYLFIDGHVIEGVWSKRWREDRTRYWNPTGEEVRFNRGNMWVSILPYGSPLAWE